MLIVSHVCAEFHDANGETIFTVTPATRKDFIEAPEAIRQDPLFDLLVADGSLEAAFSKERRLALENDPESGFDATGKAIHLPEKEEEIARKAAKSVKAARPKADPDIKPEAAASDPAPSN